VLVYFSPEAVRETVPADRLLVWQVKDGWEPLCAMLGVPVPDEPFPRTNDAAGFRVLAKLDDAGS